MTEPLQLSPFVYWAQTETHITLKVDLKDVKVKYSPMHQLFNIIILNLQCKCIY